ncbi:hexosaminidase D [Ischnura elegans]|uniref:hexosaminidase D n=1 Tax=Ischnura elegans TaxID=197161 RepID=UPI001ED8685A|nr:hexosaminidase D [Ischnura elegans]
MRLAASYAGRLGFTAWRRKSTLLAAIAALLLFLVCLQYSAFGVFGRSDAAAKAVPSSDSGGAAPSEETPPQAATAKQRRVQFVLNQADSGGQSDGVPSKAPRQQPEPIARLPDPPAREDVERRNLFLQEYSDDKGRADGGAGGDFAPDSGADQRQPLGTEAGAGDQGAAEGGMSGTTARQALYVPPHRIVHLDLKGAPPTAAYIKRILPILVHLGATGLLVEWEDAFPWTTITPLAAANAYSRQDVMAILSAAYGHGLEVIPLVQTFGHLEFALKHQEWSALREDDRVPTALCPSLNASRTFVEKLLDEVVKAHTEATPTGRPPKYIHIGCDEVFQLGECPRCRSVPRERLFLGHVAHVAAHVRNRYGSIPLVWDDMLRHVSPEAMKESGLGSLVEPMVWVYAEDVYRFVPPGVWDKYATIFPRVWAASAFKGAFGETVYVPNAKRHLDNNLRWLDVMAREGPKFRGGFRGLVLTGWQRYDHFAVLCELLPSAMPSLAVSLLAASKGHFNASLRKDVHAALSCPDSGLRDPSGGGWADLSGDPFLWDHFSRCIFPGALVFRLTARLQSTEREFAALTDAVHHRRGWMTPFNVRHNFSSPLRVEEEAGVDQLARLQQSVEALIRSARDSLADILDPYAIAEWIEQRMHPMVVELESIARDASVLKSRRTWPARPLPYLDDLRRFGVTVPPLPTTAPPPAGSNDIINGEEGKGGKDEGEPERQRRGQ